jgi:hypothetical protein
MPKEEVNAFFTRLHDCLIENAGRAVDITGHIYSDPSFDATPASSPSGPIDDSVWTRADIYSSEEPSKRPAIRRAGKQKLSRSPNDPAVPINKSVHDDYIICLEDGKKLKMLKRYLSTQYGLTPDEYRKRWGLPPNYPMIAANYRASKSEYAKQTGLGTYDRQVAHHD